jgi:hypothetical protein
MSDDGEDLPPIALFCLWAVHYCTLVQNCLSVVFYLKCSKKRKSFWNVLHSLEVMLNKIHEKQGVVPFEIKLVCCLGNPAN